MMTIEEQKKKLELLPWQALYDLARTLNNEEHEIKGKEKACIISLLVEKGISDALIDSAVNDYIYGDRITFTIWNFNSTLCEADYDSIKKLEYEIEPFIDEMGFRALRFVSVEDHEDRLQIVYVYSKEYQYINEQGKRDSIWEQHRGCVWIGRTDSYLACISKHEKMTHYITSYLASTIHKTVIQLKPPKSAIERCVNYRARSRVVLQGLGGEKTVVSNPEGFTENQIEEVERLRWDRIDTSGSYIANIAEDKSATVKYNVNKGSLGIYKHLPATVLFSWSREAIRIIQEEINHLKGQRAEEIFSQLGLEIKWKQLSVTESGQLNWFLTEAIAALDKEGISQIQIPSEVRSILDNPRVFSALPRIYCEECESYEIPHCHSCGAQLKYLNKKGWSCGCGAPVHYVCSENHNSCREEFLYIPTDQTRMDLNRNIKAVFGSYSGNCNICVINDMLYISLMKEQGEVEICFDDIKWLKEIPQTANTLRDRVVWMKEKCEGTCSRSKIEVCTKNNKMSCLPKVFYGIIPGFRPQPHKGSEYGDVSGQVCVSGKSYEFIGIIKKNSENKTRGNAKIRTEKELIQSYLLNTSNEGQEIIRQFVTQGMQTSGVSLIGIIAPQYFDHSLKGTIRFLAKLGNKKVVFIELDQLCRLVASNKEMIDIS